MRSVRERSLTSQLTTIFNKTNWMSPNHLLLYTLYSIGLPSVCVTIPSPSDDTVGSVRLLSSWHRVSTFVELLSPFCSGFKSAISAGSERRCSYSARNNSSLSFSVPCISRSHRGSQRAEAVSTHTVDL